MESRRYFCLLTIAVILAVVRVSHAQEDTWTSGGPYEASVWSIAIDPADNQRLYIATLENFIFQTTDGGAEWSHIPGSPDPEGRMEARNVRVVKIHPFGPDTIFIATGRGAYKSTDAGQSWSRLPLIYPGSEWDRMELSRTDPPVLFVANGFPGASFRSTDGGATWLAIPFATGAIKADPVSPNIIYLAAQYQGPSTGTWKSTDSGATWQNISNNRQVAGGTDIEIDPVDPQILYITGRSGPSYEWRLSKSIDGGGTWIDITPPDLTEGELYNVEVAPLDHNTIIVCSRADGVLRSTDGGATWEEANQGIIGTETRAQTLTSDHATGIIYLGFYASGIYKSTNDGASWQKISYNVTGSQVHGIAANRRDPDILFVATLNAVYMSVDGAASWEYVDLRSADGVRGGYYVEIDPYDPSYIYVTWSRGEIYRSTDGGATWESFTQGLPPDNSYGKITVADYGNGVRRLFIESNDGLYRSDDLGESWFICAGGLPADIEVVAVEVSPVNPDLVFVGEPNWSSGRLYKTTDGGETWASLPNFHIGTIYDGIACDPLNADIIYIVGGFLSTAEIYKSTNGGLSWAEISNNIPRESIFPVFTGLAVNPLDPDNIFALSYNRGFFQSHDGGGSWEDFNLNMETTVIMGYTLIDPVDTSRIFLAIDGGSVWTITRTQTGIDLVDNTLPAAFSASSYPNPFNPSATIEYSLPVETFVTVDIYDLLGRKVERLVSRDQRAGNYRVVWDAREQASGVYFYRIDAGEISDMRKMILLK